MKIVILGLDGMNLPLANLCKEQMPNLQQIISNGVSGDLKTIYPPLSAAAWTSILTGKLIANHGILNAYFYDSNHNLQILEPDDMKEKRFYEILNENGFKCFIMNIYFASGSNLEGDFLEWRMSTKNGGVMVKPGNLVDRYPAIDKYLTYQKKLKNYHKIVHVNGEIIKQVMTDDKHDFMFFQISVLDWLQHRALSDLIHRPYSKKVKIARNVLKDIDNLIGWIIQNLKGKQFLIVSDHGLEEKKGTFLINTWLKNQGYLTIAKKGTSVETVYDEKGFRTIEERNKFSFDITKLVSIVKKNEKIWSILRRIPIQTWLGKLPINLLKEPKIDYNNSKAVCLIKNVPLIKILEKDEEQKKLIKKKIIDKINQINGLKAKCFKEYYKGKYAEKLDHMGDIVVDMGEYEFDIYLGAAELVDLHSTNHSSHGIFAALGTDIKSVKLGGARVADIAPTILHMFNLPVPEDMDGKVLGIFKDGSDVAYRKVQSIKESEQERNRVRHIIEGINLE